MSASAPAPAVARVEGGLPAVLDADPHAGAHPGHGTPDRDVPDREAAWAHALEEMEAVADRAENLIEASRNPEAADVAVTEPWRAPRGLGALPVALAPRAAALVERQRDLMRRTAGRLDEQRRALRTADGLRTRPAAAPVYLDVEG